MAGSPSIWSGRNVLVTGATGLLGSWLIKDLLDLGASVVSFVRDCDPQSELVRSGDYKRTRMVSGALEDYAAIARTINELEVQTVFHLGAQTIVGAAQRSPLQTFESNIRGTYNLLEACRLHPTLVSAVVVASSDKAYGHSDKLPYTEDLPLSGKQPYELSKSCTDLISQGYFHSYKLPVSIARCGNIYGGGDLNWSRIIPGTIMSCLRGIRPVIRSDGTFVRDYLYVKDASRAYICLAEQVISGSEAGEAFNFSPEKALSVIEIVKAILELTGHTFEPEIQNIAAGEIHSQYLDATKAKNRLGWKPEFKLQDGLKETIAWYQKFATDLPD
jgi:CDP-glucose 4,6-dehydratase